MRYPWHVSMTGEYAELSRSDTVPAKWQPPYTLTFFCSDDYSDYRERPKTSSNSIDSYPGHRFKEVLIDGKVAWQRDIADDSAPGTPTDFAVDVTSHVKPGGTFVLALRNTDQVGLAVPLLSDFYLHGIYEGDRPGGNHVLATTCYWGDVTLWQGVLGAVPAWPRPSSAAVHAVHETRRARVPEGSGARLPATLAPEGIDRPLPAATPVICGVPLPEGVTSSAGDLSLQLGPMPLPWQPEMMNRWPDGSVRWVLVNTVLPAGMTSASRLEMAHTPSHHPVAPDMPVSDG